MKMTDFKKSLSTIICIVLITAMALMTIGCEDNSSTNVGGNESIEDTATESSTESDTEPESETEPKSEIESDTEKEPAESESSDTDSNVLGEGETVFYFTVTDLEAEETAFEIHTDKTTVGEALLDLGLIAGEDGDYGLYVKTVNGLTVDYDTDGKYWAFYIDGAYAMTGVDMTDITAGATYAFKAE